MRVFADIPGEQIALKVTFWDGYMYLDDEETMTYLMR